MIFTKIWERYFVVEFLKTFFLFIFSFYGIYVLLDYSTHVRNFSYVHLSNQWKTIILYYGSEFIKRIDVFIPFALLIATVKTLTRLNQHHELVALMTSGIKLQTLMRPFLIVGFVFTGLIYLSTEFILPSALKELRHLNDARRVEKNKKFTHALAQHIALEDQTTIIFQSYDSSQQQFFDVYWIRSANDIYRMKYLYPYTSQPKGLFVDHLVRNSKGDLVNLDSAEEKSFPEMHFNKERLFETLTAHEESSFTKLFEQLTEIKKLQSEKDYKLFTIFHYKLVMPWLCILAIIAPAPFCVRYSRNLQTLLIYACGIFGLVAFNIILDSASVLAKRQVLYPFYAIWIPFLLVFTFFGWRFFRLSVA